MKTRILVTVTPLQHRYLKVLAAGKDVSLSALVLEALADRYPPLLRVDTSTKE